MSIDLPIKKKVALFMGWGVKMEKNTFLLGWIGWGIGLDT